MRPSLSCGTRSNWSCVGPSESASRKEYSESALFGVAIGIEADMSGADGSGLLWRGDEAAAAEGWLICPQHAISWQGRSFQCSLRGRQGHVYGLTGVACQPERNLRFFLCVGRARGLAGPRSISGRVSFLGHPGRLDYVVQWRRKSHTYPRLRISAESRGPTKSTGMMVDRRDA